MSLSRTLNSKHCRAKFLANFSAIRLVAPVYDGIFECSVIITRRYYLIFKVSN